MSYIRIKYGDNYIVNVPSIKDAGSYILPCDGKINNGNITIEYNPNYWSDRQGLVPAMTSNTTPSGVCSASAYTTYAPWYAFNGTHTSTDDGWEAPSTSLPQWIQYEFPETVYIDGMSLWNHADGSYGKTSIGYLMYSNDGTNWTEGYHFEIGTQSTDTFNFDGVKCKYIRCYITAENNGYSTSIGVRIHTLQYYGNKPII